MSLLLVAACVDNGDLPTPGEGEPDTGTASRTVPRMFGIDVGAAPGEAYSTALSVAGSAGTTFVPMSLDWSMLEAGPDDTFSHAALDTKKWDVSGAFAPDANAGVVRYAANHTTTAGNMRTRYTLGGDALSAEVAANLLTGDGTEATLLLRFGPYDTAGTRCSDPQDQYAALVLIKSSGATILVGLTCRNGVIRNEGAITTLPAATTLRISRSPTTSSGGAAGGSLLIRSATSIVSAISLSLLPPAFAGPARVSLFAGTDAGGFASVTLAAFHVAGTATWDNPDDRYVGDPAFDVPAAIRYIHAPLHTPLVITLRAIDTVATHLPSDLNATDPTTGLADMSRPEIRQRYKAAVDNLMARMPDVVIAGFSISNEVDGYLRGATAWAQATAFANDVIPYVSAKLAPGNPVGITVTSFGLRTSPTEITALENAATALFVTYYPLDSTFAAKDPSVVPGDINAMLATTTKPLLLIEAGYPSASFSPSCWTCTGSQAKQAAFFHQMFLAWDAHPDRILGFSVSWLTDLPTSTLAGWGRYYGITSQNFLAYLGSIGVRSASGVPKPALATISSDAHARGF